MLSSHGSSRRVMIVLQRKTTRRVVVDGAMLDGWIETISFPERRERTESDEQRATTMVMMKMMARRGSGRWLLCVA